MKAFISYSHQDDAFLKRLHTHLAVLRRERGIDEWFDQKILAGADLDKTISKNLERCQLFLALVSPDFLASGYCYDREMARAIELHDEGKMRVIPIIIEPCDWKSSPLVRFKAIPKDGKPISEWTNPNIAFLEVVTELRRILAEAQGHDDSGDSAAATNARPAEGRRYRLKRDFDTVDRSDFRRSAFSTIKDYFRASISEINSIGGIKARYEEIGPQSFTCSVLNPGRERGASFITVHSNVGGSGLGDIYFSNAENAPPNSANGAFNVDSDEYDLFLRPALFVHFSTDEKLSPQRAAEILWTMFLDRAGITHE